LFKKSKGNQQVIEHKEVDCPAQPEIKHGQELVLRNVLRYRAKTNQTDLIATTQRMGEVIAAAGAKKDGYTATATYGFEAQDGQQIIDMEINIPLDKPIEAELPYEFLPEFTIANAAVVRHEGNPQGLERTMQRLIGYINENGLTPNTPAYNVTVRDAFRVEDIDTMIIDLYVGIA
jgi:effector-binding domain-containing protein